MGKIGQEPAPSELQLTYHVTAETDCRARRIRRHHLRADRRARSCGRRRLANRARGRDYSGSASGRRACDLPRRFSSPGANALSTATASRRKEQFRPLPGWPLVQLPSIRPLRGVSIEEGSRRWHSDAARLPGRVRVLCRISGPLIPMPQFRVARRDVGRMFVLGFSIIR